MESTFPNVFAILTTERDGAGLNKLCISYTMDCPPVFGDSPRALAGELSYVQVDKHGITIFYHPHQCRPCTSRDIHAKVGKGGTKPYMLQSYLLVVPEKM